MILRLTLIAALGLTAAACTIDGPEPGSTGVVAEMERQERIRVREEERRRLCSMMSRDTERYEQQCTRDGGQS